MAASFGRQTTTTDRPAVSPSGAAGADAAPSALAQYRGLSRALAISDACCVAGALGLAYEIAVGPGVPSLASLLVIAIGAPVWVAIFALFRLYELHRVAPSEEFRRVFGALSLGVTLIVATAFWFRVPVSRTWMGLSWLFSVVLVLGVRRLWHLRLHRARLRGRFTFRTLVVGSNEEADLLVERLRGGVFGFEPVAAVATNGQDLPTSLAIAGSTQNLAQAIRGTRAECLFVASSAVPETDMPHILKTARHEGTLVWVSANLPEVMSGRLSARSFGEVTALSLRPVHLSGWQVATKRVFDLLIGGPALAVSLPLWAAVAIAIKTTSRGPLLFRQERVTKGGRTFTMYKFRTMVMDCDDLLEGEAVDPTSPFFKLADDPRLTAVGRWLRRTSIDELPQLWNVLKGDMSLVGPRPLPAEQVRANAELLEARHEVRAGITGWWQINGRSELDPHEAVKLDLFYIENWSLAQDLFILAKTFPAVLFRKGAV